MLFLEPARLGLYLGASTPAVLSGWKALLSRVLTGHSLTPFKRCSKIIP